MGDGQAKLAADLASDLLYWSQFCDHDECEAKMVAAAEFLELLCRDQKPESSEPEPPYPNQYECPVCGARWTGDIEACPRCQDADRQDASRYRLVRPMLVAMIEEAASGAKALALRPRLGRTFFDKTRQVPSCAADEILNAQLDAAVDGAINADQAK